MNFRPETIKSVAATWFTVAPDAETDDPKIAAELVIDRLGFFGYVEPSAEVDGLISQHGYAKVHAEIARLLEGLV